MRELSRACLLILFILALPLLSGMAAKEESARVQMPETEDQTHSELMSRLNYLEKEVKRIKERVREGENLKESLHQMELKLTAYKAKLDSNEGLEKNNVILFVSFLAVYTAVFLIAIRSWVSLAVKSAIEKVEKRLRHCADVLEHGVRKVKVGEYGEVRQGCVNLRGFYKRGDMTEVALPVLYIARDSWKKKLIEAQSPHDKKNAEVVVSDLEATIKELTEQFDLRE